jgi:hypothetical protein
MEDFIGMIAAALGKAPPRLRLPRVPLRAAAAVLGILPRWPLSVSRVGALSNRAVYSTTRIETRLDCRRRRRITVQDALERTVVQWRAEHTAR